MPYIFAVLGPLKVLQLTLTVSVLPPTLSLASNTFTVTPYSSVRTLAADKPVVTKNSGRLAYYLQMYPDITVPHSTTLHPCPS